MGATVLKSGGKILNRVSGAVGNADTDYVYLLCKHRGKTAKALNWTITATTLTLEASNDDLPTDVHFTEATAAQLAALNWIDVTETVTGSENFTATNDHTFDEDFGWRYIRVKLVTTNATNACDLYYNRG